MIIIKTIFGTLADLFMAAVITWGASWATDSVPTLQTYLFVLIAGAIYEINKSKVVK